MVLRGSCTLAVGGGEPIPLGPGDVAFLPWGAALAHPWTVAELAATAGLSRATLARRFSTLIGRPPLAYLIWWRMTTAAGLLRSSDIPLAALAGRVGYASEYAFAHAFKREHGIPPGAYRLRKG